MTTNIYDFDGGGHRLQRGKSSKNTVFLGKRHDNISLKVQILLSSWRRLLQNLEYKIVVGQQDLHLKGSQVVGNSAQFVPS